MGFRWRGFKSACPTKSNYPGLAPLIRLMMVRCRLLRTLLFFTTVSMITAVAASSPVAKPRGEQSIRHLPISFEENCGQADPEVRFVARGLGYALFVTDTETVAVLRSNGPQRTRRTDVRQPGHPTEADSADYSVLRMKLAGAHPHAAVGEGLLPGKSNYFIGSEPANWRTNIPQFSRAKITNIYEGIDVVYHSTDEELEYDFNVRAGADPQDIRMIFDGAEQVDVDRSGDLLLHIDGRLIRQRLPVAYQQTGGERVNVEAAYKRINFNTFGLTLGNYDCARPLVIDPTVVYSTSIGGNGDDEAAAIAVDAAGNAYVAGYTFSSDFPATSGAFRTTRAGSSDAAIVKLSADGSTVLYSTFLGGSRSDGASAIVVDAFGNAYVTGDTASTDFPTTSGAFQTINRGTDIGFVTKLDPTGGALVFSTYLGGSLTDQMSAIAIDASRRVIVVGGSTSSDFPTTPDALQRTNRGATDIAFSELDASGSVLLYSTLLGGDNTDGPRAVALDGAGNAYMTGVTFSADFPTTTGAFQRTRARFGNAFVTKITSAHTLGYSTYLGGSTAGNDFESGNGIAADSLGNAYVVGLTPSTDFPTTVGAPQKTFGGDHGDGFVTKVNPTGTSLLFSTFLGGSGFDQALAVAVDAAGNVLVGGITFSANFPKVDPIQATFGGPVGFVARLDSAGAAFTFSTYVSPFEAITGIQVDPAGTTVYVCGFVSNSPAVNSGSEDYVVAKISMAPPSHVIRRHAVNH
jgi:hypothetical protein